MKTLGNTKVFVGKHSKEIQEKLFSLGYKWEGNKKTVSNLGYSFLFASSDKYITCSNGLSCFNTHSYNEISVEEILNFKPKHIFKPFDKVLVRDKNTDDWRVDLFSHETESDFRTMFSYFKQCIPYEGNEKLLNTSDNF